MDVRASYPDTQSSCGFFVMYELYTPPTHISLHTYRYNQICFVCLNLLFVMFQDIETYIPYGWLLIFTPKFIHSTNLIINNNLNIQMQTSYHWPNPIHKYFIIKFRVHARKTIQSKYIINSKGRLPPPLSLHSTHLCQPMLWDLTCIYIEKTSVIW